MSADYWAPLYAVVAEARTHACEERSERYRRTALEIHAATCRIPGCNYGEPVPAGMADDPSLPWPEQQERARRRLEWYTPCMAAVNAENAAARLP